MKGDTTESSVFFRGVIASGLITEDNLRALIAQVAQKNFHATHEPITQETLPAHKSEEEHSSVQSLSEIDFALANAAVAARHLSRWQAIQLLRGRTKFILGDFQIIGSLGRGGYGQVFLGKPLQADQSVYALANDPDRSLVAVKVLPTRSSEVLVARFLHEIEVQRKLAHPNIVRFITAGHDANVHFMVHEYIGGRELRQWIRQSQSLRYDIASAIVMAIAGALYHLHSEGLIHRDVKPANILLAANGTPKLIDMGLLAQVRTHATHKSRSEQEVLQHWEKMGLRGKVAGTVDYLAPDQIRDPNSPTPAWDIYALGCTFYHLLTGRAPFPEGTSHEKFAAHLHASPTDPRVSHPEIPWEVAKLVMSMLEKNPAVRIASCAEVAVQLYSWSSPIPPIPVTTAACGDSSISPPPVLE